MADTVYQPQFGTMRLYDETTPTPFYIEFLFLQNDFQFPIMFPRPQETIQTSRGLATPDMVRTIGDDSAIYEAVTGSFSFRAYEGNIRDILAALSNPDRLSPWIVANANPWVGVTTIGQRPNSQDVNIDTPPPRDGVRAISMVNIETLYTGVNTPTSDWGRRLSGVYFGQVQARESGDLVVVTGNYEVYGSSVDISAFTAGTDATA